MLAVGDHVLLVDGRGCHREYVVGKFDAVNGAQLRLHAGVWNRLPFTATTLRTADGLVVLRAERPAIGPIKKAYTPLYLSDGWAPPHKLVRRMERAS